MISGDSYHEIHIMRGNIFSRAKKIYCREGFWSLARTFISFLRELYLITIPDYTRYRWYKAFKSSETFVFQGKKYHYFFHPYCTTWENERTIAIPIIWNYVKTYEMKSRNILEVGNMLSYYFKVRHDILDKYEIMDGVINEDIVDFKPLKKYDLIVSIVTLEHVGWTESPPEPVKIIRAFENLRSLLSPGGQLVVAMGLGLNLQFDVSLKNNIIKFTKLDYLKRIKGHKWQEAKWEDIKDLKYDKSIPTANAIIIGEIKHKIKS